VQFDLIEIMWKWAKKMYTSTILGNTCHLWDTHKAFCFSNCFNCYIYNVKWWELYLVNLGETTDAFKRKAFAEFFLISQFMRNNLGGSWYKYHLRIEPFTNRQRSLENWEIHKYFSEIISSTPPKVGPSFHFLSFSHPLGGGENILSFTGRGGGGNM